MDIIECTKKSYETLPTGEVEDFVECTTKHDPTSINPNIYQPNIITKMDQGFNEDMK